MKGAGVMIGGLGFVELFIVFFVSSIYFVIPIICIVYFFKQLNRIVHLLEKIAGERDTV